MLTRYSAMFAVLFAGTACAPATATYDGSKAGPITAVTTQLPRAVRPLRYDLFLTPDPQAMRFSGRVNIAFDVLAPTASITLNAANLRLDGAFLTMSDGARVAPRITLDNATQTASFHFDQALKRARYHLQIKYDGSIQTGTAGLFALDYNAPDGKAERALFTQFENSDARRLLPCWDEPSYKAIFSLKVLSPKGQIVVSNMPTVSDHVDRNGQRLFAFADTPPMSTYLLFLGVGDFERTNRQVDGVDLGVITRRGSLPKAQYALDSAADVLPWLNEYFGVRYPLPKLDNIAGPGQAQTFGAMENWGAIFSFERGFLINPEANSERERSGIFLNLAHEMAHQWFGDLVTMSWWDDLWLNEGFASWMEEEASKHFHPEWHAELDSIGYRDGAMDDDSLSTSHPVIQHVKSVEEAGEAFDWITYMKGEAVVHMLETYVGHDTWRASVRQYIQKHQFGNTTSEDLWRELAIVAGPEAVQIAHDFTLQPGVPLINVTDECLAGQSVVTLSQTEWIRDRPGKKPLLWHVPVIASHPDGSPIAAVIDGSGTMTLPGCGAVVVNAGHHGYYRTRYSPVMFAEIAKVYARLDPADQMGIMDDAVALGSTQQQPMSDVLTLIDGLPPGDAAQIQEVALRTWKKLYDYADGDPRAEGELRAFAVDKFGPVLGRLGWQPRSNDTASDGNLRSALIEVLGDAAIPAVADEARRLYLADVAGKQSLPPAVKTSILRTVARNADQPIWDRIRAQAKEETSLQEKELLYGLLGHARDLALQDEALALSVTDEPGATTGPGIVQAVATSSPDKAFHFALANEGRLLPKLDTMAVTSFIPDLASRSHDPATIEALRSYAAAKQHQGMSTRSADEAIAAISDTIRFRTSIMPKITQWLGTRRP